MLRNYRMSARLLLPLLVLLLGACSPPENDYDIILRGGTIYDGLGNEPVVGDLAISGDTIAAIGDLGKFKGKLEYDVRGKAVAPGFINMLSWSTESLIEDGRGMSDILQGVTLEVMGEGFSMGPLNAAMKKEAQARQGDIKYDIPWSTLGEYLEFAVEGGYSGAWPWSFSGTDDYGTLPEAPLHQFAMRHRELVNPRCTALHGPQP